MFSVTAVEFASFAKTSDENKQQTITNAARICPETKLNKPYSLKLTPIFIEVFSHFFAWVTSFHVAVLRALLSLKPIAG